MLTAVTAAATLTAVVVAPLPSASRTSDQHPADISSPRTTMPTAQAMTMSLVSQSRLASRIRPEVVLVGPEAVTGEGEAAVGDERDHRGQAGRERQLRRSRIAPVDVGDAGQEVEQQQEVEDQHHARQVAEPAGQAIVLAGVLAALTVHPGGQGVPVGLGLRDRAVDAVGMRDVLAGEQGDPGVQRRPPGPETVGPPEHPAQPAERRVQHAAGLAPRDAVHDLFTVRGARGIGRRASAVLLGDEGPHATAGHPRPSPGADPQPGQRQQATRAPAADAVVFGQVLAENDRASSVRRLGSGGLDDGEVRRAIRGLLSGQEAWSHGDCSVLLWLRGSSGGGKRDHDAAELGAFSRVQRPVDGAGLACGADPADVRDLPGRAGPA